MIIYAFSSSKLLAERAAQFGGCLGGKIFAYLQDSLQWLHLARAEDN
jgi:hypothetical protein